MFTGFFYLLRAHGFPVSLNEWMTLVEGLMLNLQHDSLTGFYELCRAVLVKSEADYDKFDQIFLEYFDGIPYEDELPEELMDWLNNPAAAMEEFRKFLRTQGYEEKSIEEILKMFEERLKEQTEEHNGGSYWIGTNGYSNFGNSGHSPQGIRVGGKSMYRRAFQVAGERRFRDFRKDNVLDIRQFQMAFRLLRQYSAQTQEAKTEFDVDETIRETCDNAGTLSVCYKRPRKNTVKVLMLMDSGGSMDYYSNLCSMLFQAARQSNHFKELHVYYFHNCIDEYLYTNPTLRLKYEVSTKKVLRECDKDYKVIFVGDATMDVNELLYPPAEVTRNNQGFSGQDWLNYILKRYRSTVWLTPVLRKKGSCMGTWGAAYDIITDLFQMYPLTVKGLEDAMEQLMVQK